MTAVDARRLQKRQGLPPFFLQLMMMNETAMIMNAGSVSVVLPGTRPPPPPGPPPPLGQPPPQPPQPQSLPPGPPPPGASQSAPATAETRSKSLIKRISSLGSNDGIVCASSPSACYVTLPLQRLTPLHSKVYVCRSSSVRLLPQPITPLHCVSVCRCGTIGSHIARR